ncbi:chitin elicitor receptor kinase 1-like [Pyrus ussuriensis x Pyrus communis]|uniref:Chitin elicitor receptor kinase 1-like n=1 Tax=Pyrus ussuriensis x Pyrus communis TaxID=2448454 RepID=A0A5N5GJ43_9ROSA|nr:chitin elicitor receptor kinase 1-like [Pyrus ussuriensis x Pyrus communis]
MVSATWFSDFGSTQMGFRIGLGFLVLVSLCFTVKPQCSKSCDALASYYVWQGTNLSSIGDVLNTTDSTIVAYNKDSVPNIYSDRFGIRVNVPFTCGCTNGNHGQMFEWDVRTGDTYDRIAKIFYSNLTTVEDLEWFNSYDPNNIPNNAKVNVTVNCTCGNSSVSEDYGLFITYPLRPEDNLDSIAGTEQLDQALLQRYNPGVNFSQGSGIVYIPGKDQNGTYLPLKSRYLLLPQYVSLTILHLVFTFRLGGGAIGGISVGVIAGVLLLAGGIYFGIFRKNKVDTKFLLATSEDQSSPNGRSLVITPDKPGESNAAGRGLTGISVDKSVEFSYEELARATDNFSLANKIGQGGFGAVYYAELRGEKAAIKKMDMQASKEFLAELNVLNVRLIGYCVEGSLFLVYEYIENGNLSQHLRGSGRDPLPWPIRVQIALDSARGLEYIHEHTVPVYIHRDIKSANILIDKNFHAKVAGFGLTKLTEVGSTSLPTRPVGTFGYMPPEYAQYGDVSPKVDVFAFGVVIFELISAKEAVFREDGASSESKGLVGLFEEVLNQPDLEDLRKLVDPNLGDNYPLDSVHKMAQLGKACTQENKDLRPSMRSIVVALMTLSSSAEDWDVGSFYENQALVNLMSGR